MDPNPETLLVGANRKGSEKEKVMMIRKTEGKKEFMTKDQKIF